MSRLGLLLILIGLSFSSTLQASSYVVKDVYHRDHRSTPKLLFNVNATVNASVVPSEEAARKYLIENAARFGLSKDLREVRFYKKKNSLSGVHYHYKQVVLGVEMEAGEIIVSMDGERVYQVFNNIYPIAKNDVQNLEEQVRKSPISADEAYEIAWQDLRVHGPLMDDPKIEKKVIYQEGQFYLVYRVFLAVEKPFGYWRYYVAINNGEVVKKEDTRITRQLEKPVDVSAYKGKVWPRPREFKKFKEKQALLSSRKELNRAQGEGLVFDPDPRTTLRDDALVDNSPESAFESAYFRRSLKDISFSGGQYFLTGPWVTIDQFESPPTAPSRTTSGRWEARRGNNAFNDVMTYYHIDQNQRYMQSLGFVDEKGIQYGSISVDSDGLNGADNSHFIPSTNRIAFGHGCVDDNEDADVILHEYGHAIHFSINSNWRGGDTGAMGEGFGDYWAGSYGLTTENGRTYNLNQIFSWDGHGAGNNCWPGRMMNRLAARYDHSRNYSAHVSIGDGIQSDELWSTPLFQALLTLIERGYDRESVDKIILEAHFGLGSGMKMRGMAKAIIATANRLYPNSEYAQVFIEKFNHHDIIEVPKAEIKIEALDFSGTGSNGQSDPGEVIEMVMTLKNVGTADANSVRGLLISNNDGVVLEGAEVDFPNIPMGSESVARGKLRFRIKETVRCGAPLAFVFNLDFQGGMKNSQSLPFSIRTGVAIGMEASRSHESEGGLSIPDNEPQTGAVSQMNVQDSEGEFEDDTLKVHVDIRHTFIADLRVLLTSPDGRSVLLHKQTGGGKDNIIGTYPTTLTPEEPLSMLQGATMNGPWSLKVTDHAGADHGRVLKWGLEAVSRYECE